MKPSATIIGGSMAGLFAATALSKKGWDVSVHEKVPVPLSGRGAGIATYDELADLVFKATNNNNVLGTTAKSRVSLDINGKIINSYDYPQVYTSWQYLFSILREQISNDDYFMGDDCIKIEQNEDKAIAFFENGKKKETDLIIVANGIKSELRTYVDNKAYPQYAGYVGWRGVVNEEEISKNSLKTLSNSLERIRFPRKTPCMSATNISISMVFGFFFKNFFRTEEFFVFNFFVIKNALYFYSQTLYRRNKPLIQIIEDLRYHNMN